MAKREIKRALDTPANSGVIEAERPTAVEVKKSEVKDDGVILVKAPAVVIVRVLKGVCVFQDKFKTRRIPIDTSKPVQIRITQ